MLDVVKVAIRSGKGGNGSYSFRREKNAPKGGPDGGDGGDGGSVYVVYDDSMRTLDEYGGHPTLAAEDGGHGAARQMSGENGADLEIKVPPGTIVWELESLYGERKGKIAEILRPGDRVLIAKGGWGGRGNQHFKNSRNQTPMEYEVGGEAEEKIVLFELKLLADIGLVGLPNAGKSTLLSVLTHARPKIANYPFTTLEPYLGMMEVPRKSGKSQFYVLADIPGLIEEASQGKGLGHQFLRHIERCRLLVFLLSLEDEYLNDPDTTIPEKVETIFNQFDILRDELRQHNEDLAKKPFLVALNKIDLLSPDFLREFEKQWQEREIDSEIVEMSAATHDGLDELQSKIDQKMEELGPSELENMEKALPVFSLPSQQGKPVKAIRPPLKTT